VATSESSSRLAPDKSRKDATINVRVPAKTRELIDIAAAMSGKTRTEFILESSKRSAEEVLLDQTLFPLGEEGFRAFMDVLDRPNPPNSALKSLLSSKAPWET
jgi:uncharacterized protein (DUF1778 family)